MGGGDGKGSQKKKNVGLNGEEPKNENERDRSEGSHHTWSPL